MGCFLSFFGYTTRTIVAKKYITKTTCRVCGGRELAKVLDLGSMPAANSFLTKEELKKPEKTFPLQLYFCKTCGLVQLIYVVHPKYLFKHYDYMTSASTPLTEYFVAMGAMLKKRFIKSKRDLVIEIGGNDGVLLESLKGKVRVLNIEPAKNIAKLSRKRGVKTINTFFSEQVAKSIPGPAAVVTASNVVAHMDDLDDTMRGIASLIGDTGVFVCEVHWVGNLIGDGGFDQIYHEHLCYFSLHAFRQLMRKFGLEVFDVELTNMHGAILRLFVGRRKAQPSVAGMLAREKKLGLHKLATYRAFAKRVEKNRKALRSLLLELRNQNKKIVGYGAPAKGNTLLNSCGIDHTTIDFIIDTTPFKQGLFTPGGHIPVYSPKTFAPFHPDYALLLAWNYADAIMKKERAFRDRGGKFIIPVPRARII